MYTLILNILSNIFESCPMTQRCPRNSLSPTQRTTSQ